MRLLIAPDKFKGSLTAVEAAQALADGWRAGWPSGVPLEIRQLAVADGGEGTADTLRQALGGSWISCPARDALGRPVKARYALAEQEPGRRVAVIEMSEASGLWRLAADECDPLRTSTFGTGELLRHAFEESGADQVILGLGGSATNDGGLGLACALGYRFLDAAGRELGPEPAGLRALEQVIPPASEPWRLLAGGLLVACDVRNPLLGARGATRMYGSQKGLREETSQDLLEAGLERLAQVMAARQGVDRRDAPGAGAAGGLGFGLMAFCGAELRPGFDVVAQALELEGAVAWADVVLTGEGRLDAQTLEGKAPLGLARLARRHDKRVFAFAGAIEPGAERELRRHFESLCDFRRAFPGLTKAECIAGATDLLQGCARQVATKMSVELGAG